MEGACGYVSKCMEFASVSCSWPPPLPIVTHSTDTESGSRIFSGCKVFFSSGLSFHFPAFRTFSVLWTVSSLYWLEQHLTEGVELLDYLTSHPHWDQKATVGALRGLGLWFTLT